MSQVWSEINKVVNVFDLTSQSATAASGNDTDIVNMENYKKLTYLIYCGSTAAANKPVITVYGGETNTGATAAIGFRYRTQLTGTAGTAGTTGSDAPSSLTSGTSVTFTTSNNGGVYMIEVDPSIVAAADTGDNTYDHVKMTITNVVTTDCNAQIYGVLAILSEPRYPQAILQTAID